MRPIHIVLLVVAGALGGAVVTKIWQARPAKAPAPVVARVEQPVVATPPPAAEPAPVQPAAPAANPETAAAPAAKPAPAAAIQAKPSPMRQNAPPARHANMTPPPANPRPVELGQAIPPVSAAPVAPPPAPAPAVAIAPPPPAPAPVQATPPPPPAPAPQPEPSNTVTLNAGTMIPVRLVDGLSSERNQAGDTFFATLDRELVVDGWVIAERGARVEGRVVAADRGTKAKGNASLAVELTRMHTSDGQMVAIQTDSFERHAATDRGTDAAKVGGGAIIGAVIGGIAGGGKGAAIGAGVGGGAGAGDVMLTRKPATLPTETRVSFRLRAPVTLTEKRD